MICDAGANHTFSSQAFWDSFDQIDVDPALRLPPNDELEQAQAALLDVFRAQGLTSQRVLAYDTTNFRIWTASTNLRNQQKRHDLRQVRLSYALDGRHGLSLCHHVYPGIVADSDKLPCGAWRACSITPASPVSRSRW